ncbi:hypothetical protein OUZ56_007089 [Daphnia magna]|uniref:Ndc10 domain-containing protein n=1 Tax=Daphnia magna TaxID=35525 RepID=A0ABQ9YXJ3_9CRUS|nr:hypothetical protein OUZ56_007089 [Daphnia magna]
MIDRIDLGMAEETTAPTAAPTAGPQTTKLKTAMGAIVLRGSGRQDMLGPADGGAWNVLGYFRVFFLPVFPTEPMFQTPAFSGGYLARSKLTLPLTQFLEKYVGWDKLDPNIVGDPSCYQNILQVSTQFTQRMPHYTTHQSLLAIFQCREFFMHAITQQVREQTNEKEPRAASSQKLVEPGTLF